MIQKICEYCGKEFEVIPCREQTARFCCKKCFDKAKHAKDNATCTYCGKGFHVKESQLVRYKRTIGIFCSRGCLNEYRKIWMAGVNNHQYGLKGDLNSSFKGAETTHRNHNNVDVYVYVPDHPFADRCGRILKHRNVVEQNHEMFGGEYFETIDGMVVMKKEYHIHHKDGNHDNNDVNNLEIVTRSQHRSIHNRGNVIMRDSNGRITGVFKQGELLGSPAGDNQQPSSRSAQR